MTQRWLEDGSVKLTCLFIVYFTETALYIVSSQATFDVRSSDTASLALPAGVVSVVVTQFV